MKNNIKEARKEKNLTQSDLAEKANVARTIISQLENGSRTNLSTDTIVKIATALDRRVEEVFFF